jgi:DNA polymerase III epsilon subunit-like protein
MIRRLAAAAMRVGNWGRRGRLVGARLPLARLFDPGFVAIDLETTGLDPRRDAIVSVAAIPFTCGRATRGFVTLVNPGRSIPPAATMIHGIDDAAVAGAPLASDVLPWLAEVCARRIVVGHDVHFDLAMFRRSGVPVARAVSRGVVLDTRRLARAVNPRADSLPLETLAADLGIDVTDRHTAQGDARMAGEILLALLPALEARGARTVADLLRLQRSALR